VKNVYAKGHYINDNPDGNFLICKGSTIANNLSPSCRKVVETIREELAKQGKLVWDNGKLMLIEDVVLKSPNQAANLVLGYPVNKHEWKEEIN
jgi:hypothetical protein